MSSFIRYGVQRICGHGELRARICKHFKEPRNRFLVWRTGTTTLFDVPAHQATQAGGIDSSELIHMILNVYKFGLRMHTWPRQPEFSHQDSVTWGRGGGGRGGIPEGGRGRKDYQEGYPWLMKRRLPRAEVEGGYLKGLGEEVYQEDRGRG
jgi:hypothetical protein